MEQDSGCRRYRSGAYSGRGQGFQVDSYDQWRARRSSETKKDDIELPAENEAEPADVEKKVAELDTDSSTKAVVTESIQDDSKQSAGVDAATSAESKTDAPAVDSAPVEKDAEPAVVEKAPESAEGAAQAIETVKATE